MVWASGNLILGDERLGYDVVDIFWPLLAFQGRCWFQSDYAFNYRSCILTLDDEIVEGRIVGPVPGL